jgi:hypothetical protein
MVDRGDVKKAAGRLRVDAVAWYVPGKIGSAFVKGEGDSLWGGAAREDGTESRFELVGSRVSANGPSPAICAAGLENLTPHTAPR